MNNFNPDIAHFRTIHFKGIATTVKTEYIQYTNRQTDKIHHGVLSLYLAVFISSNMQLSQNKSLEIMQIW